MAVTVAPVRARSQTTLGLAIHTRRYRLSRPGYRYCAMRTPAELRAQIEAERAGAPFLIWRAGDGAQRILPLGAAG